MSSFTNALVSPFHMSSKVESFWGRGRLNHIYSAHLRVHTTKGVCLYASAAQQLTEYTQQ